MRGRWMQVRLAPLVRRLGADRRGSIAVESAFGAILLMGILAPLIDFGLYVETRIELKQALRAGAQYALQDSSDTSFITSTVQNATDLSSVSVTVGTPYCLCAGGTSAACLNEAGFSVCSNGIVPATFLDVTASTTFNPFFPILPWMSENMAVSEQLTMRVF